MCVAVLAQLLGTVAGLTADRDAARAAAGAAREALAAREAAHGAELARMRSAVLLGGAAAAEEEGEAVDGGEDADSAATSPSAAESLRRAVQVEADSALGEMGAVGVCHWVGVRVGLVCVRRCVRGRPSRLGLWRDVTCVRLLVWHSRG